MAALASGMALAENEKLVMEIATVFGDTSSNPIVQFFAAIRRFFAWILGFKSKGFLVITDKRVVEVRTIIRCWCITVGREVGYILPSSVTEIGYTRKATCGCFCPDYKLLYRRFIGGDREILLKGVDEAGALKAANAFYAAISAAQGV